MHTRAGYARVLPELIFCLLFTPRKKFQGSYVPTVSVVMGNDF